MILHPAGLETPGSATSDRGWSLVELMLAIVVAVVALGAIVSVTKGTADLRRSDHELSLALAACKSRLDLLRSMSLTDLAAQDGTGFPVAEGASGLVLTARDGDADGLPGAISVTVERGSPPEVIYRVRVAVDWAGASGPRKFSLVSLMGMRGTQ